ncbi:LCP family protein [Nesterenkonia populi]|uniref:LCP family protein n=1 Tax=Nesterenkonia populi TaxID=1591087 RepID=UPI0014794F6F|nr:LCP family protein [Nesterenkonia populi]
MTDQLLDSTPSPEEQPRKKASLGKRIALITFSIAGLIVVGGVAVAALYLSSLSSSYEESVNVIPEDETFPEDEDRPDAPTAEDEDGEETDSEQINILLIGSDAGGGSGEDENVPWLPNAARADSIIWVHIPHERDSVQMMSIMRDTWVPIAGQGEAKINSSLSYDGPATAVATVEDLVGVPIDHVAAVDMEGFQSLVGAMDGVNVNSPQSFTSRDGYHFSSGPQHMSPSESLSFVRERQAFADGDYTRVANQQAFMQGVLSDVLNPQTLSNPARVHEMVSGFTPHMTVDSQLADSGYIADLGWNMRSIRSGDVTSFTLPNGGIGTAGSESIVIADYNAFTEAGEAMREGTFDEYAAQH